MPYRSRHMSRPPGLPRPTKFYSHATNEAAKAEDVIKDLDEDIQIQVLKDQPGGLSRKQHELYDDLLKSQEERHDDNLKAYQAELNSYFPDQTPMPKPLPKSSLWLEIYYPRNCPWDEILPWCVACAEGDLDSVKRWLVEMKRLLSADAINDGLACAADGMQATLCDYLLNETGATIHGAVVRNACRRQSVEVFQVLLKHGYHPDQQVPSNAGCYGTALRHCLGSPELTKLLLEHGADPDVGTWTDGRVHMFSARATPPMDRTSGFVLDIAVNCHSLQVIKILLDHGTKTEYARPLIWLISPRPFGRGNQCGLGNQREFDVVRDDWKEVADALLQHGADINERTFRDGTPLHCALQRDRWDIVRYLLIRGADPRVRWEKNPGKKTTSPGSNALMYAAEKAGVSWEYDKETQQYVAHLLGDESASANAPATALQNPLLQLMQELRAFQG